MQHFWVHFPKFPHKQATHSLWITFPPVILNTPSWYMLFFMSVVVFNQPLSVNPWFPDLTPSMPLICSACFWSWLLQLTRRSSELGFQVDEWRMADWQAGEVSWGWKDCGCWAAKSVNVSIVELRKDDEDDDGGLEGTDIWLELLVVKSPLLDWYLVFVASW